MSSLALNNLDSLLNLPCIIDGTKSLLLCRIISTANLIGNSHFSHTIKVGESLAIFLARIYEDATQCDMDCSLYAQLVSKVLNGTWPTHGGDISLYIADEDGAMPLWDSKIDEMGYIGISNESVSDTLNKLPITFKGQWAIQIGNNEFLGLTVEGPRVMSMEQWVSHLRTKLEEFCSEPKQFPSIYELNVSKIALFAGRNLLSCYFKTNQMNKWAFYSAPGFASIRAKWSSDGITIKHRSMNHSLLVELESLIKITKLGTLFDDDENELLTMLSNNNKVFSNCGKVHPLFGFDFLSLYPTIIRDETIHRDFASGLFSKQIKCFDGVKRLSSHTFDGNGEMKVLIVEIPKQITPNHFDLFSKQIKMFDITERLSSHTFDGNGEIRVSIVEIPKQITSNNFEFTESVKRQRRSPKKSQYDNKKQRRGRPNVFRMNSGR